MNENNRKLKVIAIYEMIGGFLGVLVTIFLTPKILLSVFSSSQDILLINKIVLTFILLFAFLAYIFSFVSGLFLFKKNKKGVLFSIITQIIQIPSFIIFSSSYFFVSGLEFSPVLTLVKNSLKLNFHFYVGSSFNLNFNNLNENIFSIGINLIPIFISIYLIKIYKLSKKS